MNVHTFPLVSGQELVVDLIHIGNHFVHVATPMVFQTVRHPETGQPVHGFGEWPALASTEQPDQIRIPIASILCMPLVPHEEIVRNYISNITGLELPPATPKILLS